MRMYRPFNWFDPCDMHYPKSEPCNLTLLIEQSQVPVTPIRRFKSTLPDEPHNPRDDYNVSQTINGTDACLKAGISGLGITGPSTIYKNLSFQELFEHEQKNKEGVVVSAEYGETFAIDTGKYTG